MRMSLRSARVATHYSVHRSCLSIGLCSCPKCIQLAPAGALHAGDFLLCPRGYRQMGRTETHLVQGLLLA